MGQAGLGLQPILPTDWTGYKADPSRVLSMAIKLPGQSRLRLLWRLARLAASPYSLTHVEFCRMGLYRPELDWDEVRSHLGAKATGQFNRLLNGPAAQNETAALNDKLETASRLSSAGIKVAEIRAVYPGSLTWGKAEKLDSVEAMAAYLLRPGSTPCFGKPIFGGLCRGVVAIESATSDGRLVLGDGREVEAARLAAELIATYGKGYMFQELLRASDDIRPVSGPTLPVLRVYSLWVSGGPRPMYAALRLPSPGSMSDDDAKPGCVRLNVDMQTGQLLRGQDMAKEYGEPVHFAPVTGEPLAGKHISDIRQAIDTAVEVHRRFPRHRSLGTDIGLSDRGFVVNEANASPIHLTYQLTATGLLNPTFRPIFRQALAERGISKPERGGLWPWI